MSFDRRKNCRRPNFKKIQSVKSFIFLSALALYILCLYNSAYPEFIGSENTHHFVLPFKEEELNYKVSWSRFITAGSATLNLIPGIYKDTTPVLIGKAVARSAKWMRVLGIDVEDIIETFFDPNYRFSHFFHARIKETDYKKTKSIAFDWDNNQIEYIERGEVAYFKLKGYTHDVLSALYYVRTLPLRQGESFFVYVFDEGKEYLLEIEVIALEELDIQDLRVPALKTKIILKTKGIFNRKGDVYIWFSDDMRKIPIQMQCDIFLGFFHVELVNARAFFHYR